MPTTTSTTTSSTTRMEIFEETTPTASTSVCDKYFNNTDKVFTGINYTRCDGKEFVEAEVGVGESICVQKGKLSGGDSNFLVTQGTCG